MAGFAILWLLPAVWVLVTSLKLTENIIRVPPEWIPWPATLVHYGEVLFSSSRTARIDGAGPWRIFTRILLPLSQPALGALAIFAFRSAWNDFLWPLIAVNKPEMFPLPVALALLRGAYSSESYGPIMAGATLSALPLLVVFLLANRRIIEGARVSGLKG